MNRFTSQYVPKVVIYWIIVQISFHDFTVKMFIPSSMLHTLVHNPQLELQADIKTPDSDILFSLILLIEGRFNILTNPLITDNHPISVIAISQGSVQILCRIMIGIPKNKFINPRSTV